MNLRRVASVLLARRLLLVVTVLVAGVSAYRSTTNARVYRATATLFVGGNGVAPSRTTGRASATAVQSVAWENATFAALLMRVPAGRVAVAQTHVARSAYQVAAETDAQPVADTMLLRVSITDPNPQIAAQLADAMPGVLNTQLEALAPPAVGRGPVPTAQLFEPAAVPAKPRHIDHIGRMLAAATFALVASAAIALLIEGLAISARDPEQVAAALTLPVLGTTELA